MKPTVACIPVLLLLFCAALSTEAKWTDIFAPVSCAIRSSKSKCSSTNPGGNKACCWVDNFCVSRKKKADRDPCFTPTCPPKGFDSAPNFNLEKYIAAPWYVLMQMPVPYQPKDSLYCVRANYQPLDPNNLAEGLVVRNYANKGRVNGPAMGTSGAGGANSMDLNAVPAKTGSTSPTAASKLLVGPAVLRKTVPKKSLKLVFGPYWVVAVGESKNKKLGYDWAIVSGGAPKTPTETACRTGFRTGLRKLQVNGIGLWFFARNPLDHAALVAMKKKATELGYDLSVLHKVRHRGCKYTGAR